MIDWSSVESLKSELQELGLTRSSPEIRRDPHPPSDPVGEGDQIQGPPAPQPQTHNKSVDKISTIPENTQIGGSHYKGLAIQPMRYSMKNGLNACQHTAIKYVTRYKDKGGIEDLKKAIHCIELLIQYEQEEEEHEHERRQQMVPVDETRG